MLGGLIGAIPVASSVGRQSIEQSRAASIANTIFASLRGGKFSAESLMDGGTDSLNLNTLTKSSNATTYYAYFDETAASNASDARRLHFASAAPNGVLSYRIDLRFDNNPAGTLTPYATSTTTTHAQANSVEISIHAVARPKDVYRFSSVVANRTD